MRRPTCWPLLLMTLLTGCGDEVTSDPASHQPAELTSYTPGAAAGYNQELMPDIVLGPPSGQGVTSGSTDVLSLGAGGEIVLGFTDRAIADGPGPDFIVFENPFWPGGDPSLVFAELAEVSVSEDGEQWQVFPCDPTPNEEARWPGCAGWTPTLVPEDPSTLDPALTGGDAFDLAEVGLTRARFVRIRDLSDEGAGTTAGFDLDAITAIHLE